MNCIKRVFLLLVVCFGVMMSYAQQAPFGVKGTVVDVESYQPLAGVTVTIANSQLGTTTNDKGEFFIPLPSDKSAEYLIRDRKSTRLNSSHVKISYAVFCLKKKKKNK